MTYESYGEFKREAIAAGLTRLTREEYQELVVPEPDLGLEDHLQRIRNSRQGMMVTTHRRWVKGWFAGSRDFFRKGKPVNEVGDQFLTVFNAHGNLDDYQVEFTPTVEFCEQVEMDVSFGWRRLRNGNRINVRHVNQIVVNAPQLMSPRNVVDFLLPDELNKGHKHKVVGVRGAVAGVLAEPDWVSGEGFFPYDEGPWPTCEVHLRGRSVRVFAHFGPYRNSKLATDLMAFDLGAATTTKDLDLLLRGKQVAIIGSVRSVQKTKRGGSTMTNIHLTATSILEWEELNNDE